MIALMLGIFFISFASSLTEQQRVQNNAIIDAKQSIGEVGSGRVPPLHVIHREASFFSKVGKTIEMNPFIVIGVILGLIIIVIVGIAIAHQSEDRL